MSEDEIKEIAGSGKAVIGTDEVQKLLKRGELDKVFVASNTQPNVKKELEHEANIAGASYEETDLTNEEMGVLCRKPFSIAVLGKRK